MKFAKNQVVKQVKKPTKQAEISKGNEYESRLRIFTEPKFENELKTESGWKEFKKFMATALSEERDDRISDFILYPLPVCAITKGLMSDIYKVFNAGNSYFSIDTVKKNGGEKLRKVLEQINLNRWIEEQGKKVLKNQPNTIVVIDKDKDGNPYLISVTNDRLIDFKFKDDDCTTFEYITFIHSTTITETGDEEIRIALYDEENYNVVLKDKESKYTLETRVKHGLSYCPARMFLKERLNSNGELNRRSPLSLVLSKLQEWQTFDIFQFYTDHYAPFPITEMVRSKCGNDSCVKGVIYTEDTYYADNERKTRTTTTDCPVCKSNNQIGVGAKIMLDPQEDDEPTASGKFRMISNDIGNLEYIKKKLTGIEDYVKLKTVGADNVMTKEAVNEKQIQGGFETKTNVLLDIKTNLDELYEWIAKAVAGLSIGDKPISVTANFGTEWYLISEDELQERFKNAVQMGLPKEEVDMIYQQLIETKYKGNPNKIARLKLINKLNPCPYDLTKDKIEKRKNNIISQKDLIISEKLVSFVKMFEIEQGNILEFGENLDTDQQLNKILEIIKKYADEYIKDINAEPIGSSKKADE